MELEMDIEDRLALQELNYKYAYFVDMKRPGEWADLFTLDTHFDEREFDSALFIGRDEVRAYGEMLAAEVLYALHHITNQLVWEIIGDSACGTVFAVVEALLKNGERARHHVIYEDEYSKQDGVWRFSRRVLRKTLPTELLEPAR